MRDLLTVLINAILLGGLYALFGIGLSIMLGIVKVVNLAHGTLIILSAFLAIFFTQQLGWSPLATLLIIVPLMFILGIIIQRLMLNHVLGKAMEPVLLVTFGLAIILENLLLFIFSPDARSIPSAISVTTFKLFGGAVNLPVVYVVSFLISLAVIAICYLLFQKTYLGWAIRAASDDPEITQMMGINTKVIFAYAMGLAAATAAIAGVLYGMTFTFYPTSGSNLLIVAFAVTIIGGLGTMRGVIVGAVVYAAAQLFGAHFFGPVFHLLAGYLMLVLILVVKPQGLVRGG